ncbi:transcriptional regulator TyrR [Paraglaciecola agarilytica]|uniref:transcriptional regulator TyrR n=1 Tax=Paraglaciecola chathamensis TaxID=368405 RepID=UPI001C0A42F7|nr:transcriptional regulator TyrR [Paraglaciecola agarilytica]MBU3017289.1 transcriptional regulator TyrR [Paraglaciecola agarilytica]
MRLEISCQDRLGITQDVLDILVSHEVDLRGIEINEMGKIYLSFPNMDFEEFQHLMPKIRKIEGIDDVKTIPFMPLEREQNQLRALLQTLPDPVFSVDTKGRILLINDAVTVSLETARESLIGVEIDELVKGFNATRWLESKKITSLTQKVRFIEQNYLADILPVMVPDSGGEPILAGAVFILKSEQRLGQQLTVFHEASLDSFMSIQASSKIMKKVVREAKRMAELDGPIMLYGETGSGKELIAHACHEASRRKDANFLVLNCASLPDNVAETELFGYAAGAFGQSSGKEGLLELAQGGSLFLDEVGDMSPQLQAKLLRVLQDGKFRRVGDTKEVKVDVRFICTTQKDLAQLVQEGRFREDLYYRLNVLSLGIPPLRERKMDIIPLAETFLKQHSLTLGRKVPKLTKSCVDYIQAYPWFGNVRQLENVLYRAVSLLEGNDLGKEHIQIPSSGNAMSFVSEDFEGSLDEEVKRYEKSILQRLYPSYPSSRLLAKKLGLSHTAIANKLRDYGINKKSVKI